MKINAPLYAIWKRRQFHCAILASIMAATLAQAKTPPSIVVVPPEDLPAVAQHGGNAMFLHGTSDGRTLLYIEQDQGSRLATLDVTDPNRIKALSSVPLASSGPFDFITPLGRTTELIKFRRSQQDGVLDLHKDESPTMHVVEGRTLQGSVMVLGNDGYLVMDRAGVNPAPRDFQVIDTEDLRALDRVFDVKEVQDEVTNTNTGTTFFLTENGLYLIRRPSVESDKRQRDQDWFFNHAGD